MREQVTYRQRWYWNLRDAQPALCRMRGCGVTSIAAGQKIREVNCHSSGHSEVMRREVGRHRRDGLRTRIPFRGCGAADRPPEGAEMNAGCNGGMLDAVRTGTSYRTFLPGRNISALLQAQYQHQTLPSMWHAGWGSQTCLCSRIQVELGIVLWMTPEIPDWCWMSSSAPVSGWQQLHCTEGYGSDVST